MSSFDSRCRIHSSTVKEQTVSVSIVSYHFLTTSVIVLSGLSSPSQQNFNSQRRENGESGPSIPPWSLTINIPEVKENKFFTHVCVKTTSLNIRVNAESVSGTNNFCIYKMENRFCFYQKCLKDRPLLCWIGWEK